MADGPDNNPWTGQPSSRAWPMAGQGTSSKPIYANVSRHQPVKRLLRLLKLLCHGPHTVPNLMMELECSDRTLRRMLVTLRELGVEVERRSTQKRYEPEPPYLYSCNARNAAEALGLLEGE